MKERGLNVPALERRPRLLPGLDFYLLAYEELRYDRPIGMSMGPIPWTSVNNWAIRHRITDTEEFDTLLHHIRALEIAEFEFEHERKEKEK